MNRIGAKLAACLLLGACLQAQDGDGNDAPFRLEVEPSDLTLKVGESASLKATVRNRSGEIVEATVVFFSRSRQNVGVNAAGFVQAYRPGSFEVVALVPKNPDDEPRRAEPIVRVAVPIDIPQPPIAKVEFSGLPRRFYAGTEVQLRVGLTDEAGFARQDVPVTYSSSDSGVATVNSFGQLRVLQPGTARITARADNISQQFQVKAIASPARSLELTASAAEASTGDVVRFRAVAKDGQGRVVDDLPVQYLFYGNTHPDIVAPGATAQIAPDGRFVAERSGHYTVVAMAGDLTARRSLGVTHRDVTMDVELVGHGPVRDRHTSDLWVWEGSDGRDYAITGTWGADGHAYIWDVTDPAHMSIVDVVRVDARTVNDVKVSEDGKIAVISREGASNRKNGFVVLDVSNVASGVQILSSFTDQLTGGVHNVFVADQHVYALSAGRRYDIVSIEDPRNPLRVGRFELNEDPGRSIHDVWVHDGIAYSSNWRNGVVAVDVGGGGQGGSPRKPVRLGKYAYPSGWNHAAFPYRSKSTGKFYVFAGDEAFPDTRVGDIEKGGTPPNAAGWIHVIEWDDWNEPKEVARYKVPEAGSHNLWVEDDILYVGYYNGGLRVVDVSGELMGDLYRQGREIAYWKPFDPEGYVANAPFVWGPQPYKGHVFMSDWNSGLWAVKLTPKKKNPRSRSKWKYGEPQ